jgi:hypothetical protein
MIATDTATDQMEDLHIGFGKNLFAADTWHGGPVLSSNENSSKNTAKPSKGAWHPKSKGKWDLCFFLETISSQGVDAVFWIPLFCS